MLPLCLEKQPCVYDSLWKAHHCTSLQSVCGVASTSSALLTQTSPSSFSFVVDFLFSFAISNSSDVNRPGVCLLIRHDSCRLFLCTKQKSPVLIEHLQCWMNLPYSFVLSWTCVNTRGVKSTLKIFLEKSLGNYQSTCAYAASLHLSCQISVSQVSPFSARKFQGLICWLLG